MQTLSHHLSNWARINPYKLAIIHDQKAITYRNFLAQSLHLAEQFTAAGFKEQRIAIMLKNSIELALIYYAAFQAGAIAVPLNVLWKKPQLASIVAATAPYAIIVDGEVLPEVAPVPLFPKKHCYIVGPNPLGIYIDFDHFVAQTQGMPIIEPEPSQPATLFATSGSTGEPKLIIHSHESLLAMADSMTEACDMTETDRFLISEPMINASGCTHLNLTLASGGTAILTEGIIIPTLKTILHENKPTIICVMGKANLDILHAEELDRHDFNPVRMNFTGGDKITKEFIMQFEEKTGVNIRYGYGMSECLLITVNKSRDIAKYGSVGKITKDLLMEIRDTQNQPLQAGTSGEIWVKGNNVMQGYWANPDATASTLVNGWLKTGDVAYQDKDGYIWIIGRSKNIIIRDGENVSPYEIEEMLATHPAVKIAGVIGVDDEQEGQVPLAVVELTGSCNVRDLEQFLAKRLSHLSMPKYIKIVPALPRTANGKIDRKKLKDFLS